MDGHVEYRDARSTPLSDATVQEIQLELIRRTQHNAMEGERVVRSLLQHRDLWTAVLLDRLYTWTKVDIDLPMGGLIKLRDLPYNDWNADTLYILCPSVDHAKRLELAVAKGDCAGDAFIYENQEVLSRALGRCRGEELAILQVWWD